LRETPTERSVRRLVRRCLSGHGRPIAVGEPANLTLVDPSATVTVDREASMSLSRNNPWHGRRLTGTVHATILQGLPTVLKGELA